MVVKVMICATRRPVLLRDADESLATSTEKSQSMSGIDAVDVEKALEDESVLQGSRLVIPGSS
jgi:hypothetical protein